MRQTIWCTLVTLLMITVGLPLSTVQAVGILNGEFEEPDPCGGGAQQPSMKDWRNGSPAGGDQPTAEGPGAGGTAGRARIGDDVATPTPQHAPLPSRIGQPFSCAEEDSEDFCNITFHSQYTPDAAGVERPYIRVWRRSNPQGTMVIKRIPNDALFTPHGLAFPGNYTDMVIEFGIFSTDSLDGVGDSSLRLDKVVAVCETEQGTNDLSSFSGGTQVQFDETIDDWTPFVSLAEQDEDDDGVPDLCDNCDLYNPGQADCQPNGVGDVCDIDYGTSPDENENGVPDECEYGVPTVSEWGLIVLGVVLVTVGGAIVLRRRAAAA